jgi:hypothetical protein
MFDWAHGQREKGAAKLPLVLDHQGLMPQFAVITEGKGSDLVTARKMKFTAGTILIFDRAYADYRWFERLTQEGVFFLIRLRSSAHFEVVAELPVPAGGRILRCQQVLLGAQGYRMQRTFRLIESLDPATGKTIVLLTNNSKLAATTLAQVYTDRWEIEVFFRALKQNLRVKTFVGTSANAVHIQIWTALIAILLLKYLQLRSSFPWSLSNLVALLRQQLFVHRDRWAWIQTPFEPPPALTPAFAAQLSLGLGPT